jgi:hypothetical protein
VSKLVARYRAEGESASGPRSRRPKTSSGAINEDTVELIVTLRTIRASRSQTRAVRSWDAIARWVQSGETRPATVVLCPPRVLRGVLVAVSQMRAVRFLVSDDEASRLTGPRARWR